MTTGEFNRIERDCILCGKCLEVCPLFAATGREELSPRGKSFLIQEALEKGNLGDPQAARKLLGLCLGCGRCADICPQGRNLPDLLRAVKAGHPGWQAWLWRAWITRARNIWPWMGACSKLLPGSSTRGSVSAGLHALTARPNISPLFHRVRGAADLSRPAVLFPGCMARFAKPWWVQNAQCIMGSQGQALLKSPDWNCCGFTLGQAGLNGLRFDVMQQNVKLWRDLGRPVLLTICATCTAALREYGGEDGLFADQDEQRAWGDAVRPLSGVLDPRHFRPLGGACLMYHHPCHAPSPDPDEAFLRNVFGPGLIARNKGDCCGMGGVMQLSAPELSTQVAQRYWTGRSSKDPCHVAAGCGGCVVQLSASAPEGVAVAHWLDLFQP